MILRYFDKLRADPIEFLILIGTFMMALVIGITIHEFSHAAASYSQGDSTAKRLGRLTLNPLAHLDLTGTLLLLFVGFGWGKPVPVNHNMLKNGKISSAFVAFAGPLSNILLAFVLGLLFKWELLETTSLLASFFILLIQLNIILAIFNLLPIYPLDGSHLLEAIIPKQFSSYVPLIHRFGPLLLLSIIILSYITEWDILGKTIGVVVQYFTNMFIG